MLFIMANFGLCRLDVHWLASQVHGLVWFRSDAELLQYCVIVYVDCS